MFGSNPILKRRHKLCHRAYLQWANYEGCCGSYRGGYRPRRARLSYRNSVCPYPSVCLSHWSSVEIVVHIKLFPVFLAKSALQNSDWNNPGRVWGVKYTCGTKKAFVEHCRRLSQKQIHSYCGPIMKYTGSYTPSNGVSPDDFERP